MYRDRHDAGVQLARALAHLADQNPVVVGLPRGGVPVAFEVAEALDAPLDVILVRKLGVPFQPELAMGAIGEDGVRVLNPEVLGHAHITEDEIGRVEDRERQELERRADRFRGGRGRISMRGRTVIVVDDGIATGSTARAALRVAREHGAERVVLAVPVAPRSSVTALREEADEVVCLDAPANFYAVGQWYSDFSQTTDDEVASLLQRAESSRAAAGSGFGPDDPPIRDEDVTIPAGTVALAGHLTVPEQPAGVVLFAHGSGSSRHSPRNRAVATVLNRAGIATLLFDLLSNHEELQRANVFDVDLLAGRLRTATDWLRSQPEVDGLRVGYFGASTGAAAALHAAADPTADVAAVVSRGGRPDLAGAHLAEVTAPTLLIVGGRDDIVIELNRDAYHQLKCERDLEIVPGATHLFEEPGALETVAEHARDWFLRHLATVRS